jgi:hypothetical protein
MEKELLTERFSMVSKMWFMRRRAARFRWGSLIWIVIFGLIVIIIYSTRRDEQMQLQRLADGFHKRLILELATATYDSTGIIYQNEVLLSKSAFYPFRDPLRGCYADVLLLRTEIDKLQVRWYTGCKRGRYISWSNRQPAASAWSRDLLDPEKRTLRLLQAYLWGVPQWMKTVQTVRDKVGKLSKYVQGFRRQAGCEPFVEKPLPSPLSFELPRTPSELTSYEKWLCEILGMAYLSDGWGRLVRLHLKNGQVEAVSSGADGVWGTTDDMAVVVKTAATKIPVEKRR